MKEYKVKTGFGEGDFVVIDETELASALRAQITGKVAIFKEGSVSGSAILGIKPYYNKLIGYNRNYELNNEDYREVGTKTQNEHTDLLTNEALSIRGVAPREISDSVKKLGAEKRL